MNERETAAILAGLRLYQIQRGGKLAHFGQPLDAAEAAEGIASSGGTLEPMTPEDVDELCERINTSGPDPRDRVVEAARRVLDEAKPIKGGGGMVRDNPLTRLRFALDAVKAGAGS